MRLLDIREATLAIGEPMRNASIGFTSMTASVVAIRSDRRLDGQPVVGLAFDSIGRYGKGGLLRDRFIARLLQAPPEALLDAEGVIEPRRCTAWLMAGEKEGGHGERPGAVGLLDAALWDLRAKLRGEPLWRTLAHDFGLTPGEGLVPTYASCGHFALPQAQVASHGMQGDTNPPGGGLRTGAPATLRDEVARCLDSGYITVKIKLDGRDARADALRVEQALSSGIRAEALAVDINGRWQRGDEAWIRQLSGFGLAWVEEPASPLDYEALALFRTAWPGPVATGENLFSLDDTRNLWRYGGLDPLRDRIQVDPLLAYGVPEYAAILAEGASRGWSADAFWPHAGHLHAAHLVAAFGLGSHEAAPDASRLWGGFWDGVHPHDGWVRIPDVPGIGLEHKANLNHHLRALLDAPPTAVAARG